MQICLNCGKAITEEQYDTYRGFCVNCLQNQMQQTIWTEAENRGVPICQMDSCRNLAVIKCGNCGKSICARHAMTNKTGSIVRCKTCGERQNNGRIAWRIIRVVLSVVILVAILIGAF